jgi:hypothetical protein
MSAVSDLIDILQAVQRLECEISAQWGSGAERLCLNHIIELHAERPKLLQKLTHKLQDGAMAEIIATGEPRSRAHEMVREAVGLANRLTTWDDQLTQQMRQARERRQQVGYLFTAPVEALRAELYYRARVQFDNVMMYFDVRLDMLVTVSRPRGRPPQPPEPPTPPLWDRPRRLLRVEGVDYYFKGRERPAQFAVLDLLQEKGWPPAGVDVPAKFGYRVKDAIEELNPSLFEVRLSLQPAADNTRILWRIDPR